MEKPKFKKDEGLNFEKTLEQITNLAEEKLRKNDAVAKPRKHRGPGLLREEQSKTTEETTESTEERGRRSEGWSGE